MSEYNSSLSTSPVCGENLDSSSDQQETGKEMENLNQVTDTKSTSEASEGATSLETAVDKLLRKQRNELMFELRRIQHGDRPVTGQGHKEAVEEFFNRAIHGQPEREERPESVRVEVNALVERRPVQSALTSARFRRSLENTLRGALSRVTSRADGRTANRTVNRVSPPRVDSPNPGQMAVDSTATHSVQPASSLTASREIPRAPTPPTGSGIPRAPTPPGAVGVQPAPSQRGASVPAAISDTVSGQQHRPERASHTQAWLQQHQDNSEVTVWDSIGEAHREMIIEDLSELVQRQLVTDTLQGTFRNVLESRMRDRLTQSGVDGPRVQQFIQSLPRTTAHVRNDFSDLGILSPGEQQAELLSDEVSVISATAAVSVPYAQSNAALSREIHSLKTQMKEMMNLMKLNFDLTMDVQRSVRQEVAAAISSAPNGADAQSSSRPVSSRPVNDTTCLICLDKQVDSVLYQCGHMCVCHGCGLNLRQRGSNCPVCRAPIRDIIRAYKCNVD